MQNEWETDLAGLYIQIEAKKRRILIINSGNHPELGEGIVWRGPAREIYPRANAWLPPQNSKGVPETLRGLPLSAFRGQECPRHTAFYLCSKSTGAVTSCTRKYFASAGYFRATASYIA